METSCISLLSDVEYFYSYLIFTLILRKILSSELAYNVKQQQYLNSLKLSAFSSAVPFFSPSLNCSF